MRAILKLAAYFRFIIETYFFITFIKLKIKND